MNARGCGLLALSAACVTLIGAATQAAGAPVTTGGAKATLSLNVASGGQKVRYGKRIAVSGVLSPRSAGKPLRLERAVAGRGFRPVATSRTAADGSYRFVLKPSRSGSYRAVSSDGSAASAPRRVIVVARLAGRARRHVLGGRVRVKGLLLPRLRGRGVRLQLRTRGGWKTVDRTRTGRAGRFKASFKPPRAGRYRLRVRSSGTRALGSGRDRLRTVYVYRPARASWYGPGLWGNPTSCGGALTAGRLGVANKSLPCGTRVTFRYRGRSVTVPVIDRGPFGAGREWDLTAATKRRLGFGDVGVVWSTR